MAAGALNGQGWSAVGDWPVSGKKNGKMKPRTLYRIAPAVSVALPAQNGALLPSHPVLLRSVLGSPPFSFCALPWLVSLPWLVAATSSFALPPP